MDNFSANDANTKFYYIYADITLTIVRQFIFLNYGGKGSILYQVVERV